MCLLLETVKVKNGKLYNISYHNNRLNEARKELWGCRDELHLQDFITLPSKAENGLWKCRVLYAEKIERIEFEPYVLPQIKQLRLVFSGDINYSYKYADRSTINKLYEKRHPYDDILIIKNGYLTDTSFCNIVLKNKDGYFTPSTFLLKGTKREKLLSKKNIQEAEIGWEALKDYDSLHLINAMIDIEDNICISTKAIY